MLSLDHFGLTDAGKVRQNNEDSLLTGEGRDPSLFAVADGIGGFEAGEVASSIVVESLKDLTPAGSLQEAIREANRRVYSAASSDEKLSGMGTTVVAVRVTGGDEEPEAEISHVGDSRLYLMRGGELRPLTEDHSLVAELVRSGSLTRAQASEHPQKNLITRALGAEEEVEVDSSRLRLSPGDRLMLCSDGLPDMVPEARISELISGESGADTAESCARRLVSAALSAGGTDNVTVLVVDVEGRENGAPGAGASAAGGAVADNPAGHEGAGSVEPGRPAEREPEEERGGRSRGRRSSRRRRRERSGGARRLRRERQDTAPEEQPEGSLIPGVWDRVVEEPEPPPREPTPEEVVEQFRVKPPLREREDEDPRRRRRRKHAQRTGRAIAALVRGLAALALVGILLIPPYLWWSTRYFLAYDNEEVVVYQGVPYDFFGNEMNREDRRTGIEETDIAEPYRDQVRDHRLYTEDRLQTVLDDLQEA